MKQMLRMTAIAAAMAAIFALGVLVARPAPQALYSLSQALSYGQVLIMDGTGSVLIVRAPTGILAFVRRDAGYEAILLPKGLKVDKSILRLFGSCV